MLMLKLKFSCEIKGGIYKISAFDRDFTSLFSSKISVLHTSQNTPVSQCNENVLCGFYSLS